jgi:hypothetical protein
MLFFVALNIFAGNKTGLESAITINHWQPADNLSALIIKIF